MPTDLARRPVALLEHPRGFYLYVSRRFTLEASPPYVDLKVFAGRAGREKEVLHPLRIFDIQEYVDSFLSKPAREDFSFQNLKTDKLSLPWKMRGSKFLTTETI